MLQHGLVDELNKVAEEHPLTMEEYKQLVDVLIQEKGKCIFADGRYLILSIALDWAIQKKKDAFLQENEVEPKEA